MESNKKATMTAMNKSPTRYALFFLLVCLATLISGEVRSQPPPLPDAVVSEPGTIQLLPNHLFYDELVRAIRRAGRTIDMAYFLIKPTESKKNKPARILKELIKARKRGVQVTVLLERSGHYKDVDEANGRSAAILRENGITVLFDSARKTTHVKLAIVDQQACFIGSHNLTHSALSRNNELSLRIDNPDLAHRLLSYMKGLRP
jgi:hypothetical protein